MTFLPRGKSSATAAALAPCGRQQNTQSARSATWLGREVFEREVEPAGERRMHFAHGGGFGLRVVRAVIFTSGWRSRSFISSRAE